ncbi:MAG: carbohydrate ABC transporter permease [Spirochaetia bacterium]|nr:carbohydrate ABC transporter permease [Spirochaetia bacterium]
MKAQRRKKVNIGTSISYLYLVILSVIAAFPLVWILLSSVKSKGEITGNPTSFFPKEITFDYYKIVLGQLSFTTNIGNSLFIAGVTTLLTIIIASLGAYGVVRFFTKFGKAMTRVLITTYMFPPILLAVPYSIIMGKSGLMNTRLGLIIVYLSFSVPYAIWLLVGFFQTVPLEIEEAGKIDGANKLTIFLKIVVPIVSPGIVAVAIYTFINAWNEFLYSLILLNDNSKMTVSVALKSLEGQEVLDWGTLMAASALVVVPSVVFFMIIQKKIAAGLAQGSIK